MMWAHCVCKYSSQPNRIALTEENTWTIFLKSVIFYVKEISQIVTVHLPLLYNCTSIRHGSIMYVNIAQLNIISLAEENTLLSCKFVGYELLL